MSSTFKFLRRAIVAASILALRSDAFGPTFFNANAARSVGRVSETVLGAQPPCDVTSRRSFVATVAVSAAMIFPNKADASGGATAGGAYLLRAKARYAERVKKGAAAYMALDPVLGEKNPYFQGAKDSPAEDFLAAAYLLANAFRQNSTSAPDSLPTVKKYKAFLKEYEAYLKLSKKKGGTGAASDSYATSVELLKVYLAGVEL